MRFSSIFSLEQLQIAGNYAKVIASMLAAGSYHILF